MNKIKFYQIFYILSTLSLWAYGRIPHTRLCADNECKTIISLAKTTFNYNAGDKDMVSFRGNIPCRIMAKSQGEDADLWEIEIQGRRGYAPKKMLMEQKIVVKTADLIPVITKIPTLNEKTIENSLDILSGNESIANNTEAIENTILEANVDTKINDESDVVKDLEPVQEVPVVKLDAYKTGDSEVDNKEDEVQNIHLEVVGMEEKTDGEFSSNKENENIDEIEENDSREISEVSTLKENFDRPDLNKLNDDLESDQQNNSFHLDTQSENVISSLEESKNPDGENEHNLQSITNIETIPVETDETELKMIAGNIIESDQNENVQADESEHSTENPSWKVLEESVTSILESLEEDTTVEDDEQEGELYDTLKISQNENEKLEKSFLSQSDNIQVNDTEVDQINNLDQKDAVEDQENAIRSQLETVALDEGMLSPLDNEELQTPVPQEASDYDQLHTPEVHEENVDEILVVEESTQQYEKKTEDIFSPHFTQASSAQIEETKWYEHILTTLQDIVVSMQGIYKSYYSNRDAYPTVNDQSTFDIDGYCEKDSCVKNSESKTFFRNSMEVLEAEDIKYERFLNQFINKVVAMSDLVVLLLLMATSILIFIFGHYCIVKQRKEGALICKLNTIERKLLLSEKECLVKETELTETQKKLNNIANKSFGADDMIKQHEKEKKELHDQIVYLEKELETAAEDGLELNKMVSNLLNNPSASESIMSTVDGLQQQLNEQAETIIYITNLLGEKSRENSDLTVLLTETKQKFVAENDEILNSNYKLKAEKEMVETELKSLETQFNRNLEDKINDITQSKEEYSLLKKKYDEVTFRLQSSTAQAESLKETLQKLKKFNGEDIKTIIEITDVNTKYLASKNESESLKEHLDAELEIKNRLQEQIKEINIDIERFRNEVNQHEKEKLEAQTRLDVLQGYFKEKESQLQKELSIKEAMFMKQKGDSTSTVERIKNLQEEIQGLRSQNDQLRAEIEAQSAAHKAQINAAEVRAHDSWLAAKQSERRLEEARSEASILRKNLTSLTCNKIITENNFSNRSIPADGLISEITAPSPIHMESPSSPLLNLPPPPLIPSMFNPGMSSAIPFMPPPPLPLPKEMQIRPAPLGRLMSPPPPDHRYSDDYCEKNRYRNHRYSPSQEYPTNLYETETDFSPPRSPEMYQHDRNYKYFPPALQNKKKSSLECKGSSSEKSNVLSSDEWDRQTF